MASSTIIVLRRRRGLTFRLYVARLSLALEGLLFTRIDLVIDVKVRNSNELRSIHRPRQSGTTGCPCIDQTSSLLWSALSRITELLATISPAPLCNCSCITMSHNRRYSLWVLVGAGKGLRASATRGESGLPNGRKPSSSCHACWDWRLQTCSILDTELPVQCLPLEIAPTDSSLR